MSQELIKQYSGIAIETVIRIVLLGLILAWGFNIVRPFIFPVVWGMVIAAAVLPLFNMLLNKLNGKRKLASTVFTLAMLALLLTPSIQLAGSVVDSVSQIKEQYEAGELSVPPPNESVKDWPLIGGKLYPFWVGASENLESTLVEHQEAVKKAGESFLGMLAGIGGSVLQFALSIIIAGLLLANGPACARFSNDLSIKLAGEQGAKFTKLAGDTISSVAKGVLGVAFIQALLAGIGMMLMGIPGAGILAVLVLILAIMQLPPIIILGPVAAYAFSEFDATSSTIFLVWSLIVSGSDSFLKPMFLGRGLTTPMLVILLGAIGGMMLSGIIGLFIGAVVLALIYELFYAWLYGEEALEAAVEQASESDTKEG